MEEVIEEDGNYEDVIAVDYMWGLYSVEIVLSMGLYVELISQIESA